MKKLTTRQIFAQMLKRLRKDKGISRKKLAEDIGVSVASIGYYENEDRVPDIEVLVKLADYFNVSCDELLKGVKSPNENIYKDLWLSDTALNCLRELKTVEPINPHTQISYIFEFFDLFISDFRFKLFMKYFYRYTIGFDGFVELNDASANASAEALTIMDEFLGIDKDIGYRLGEFRNYYMFAAIHLLNDIAMYFEPKIYSNLTQYEDYMADKIDQICNSKTVKETTDNVNNNPKNE